MEYVDGFVAAVPSVNKDKYFQHAKDAAQVFKEYGAIRLAECWGDDVPDGETTSFSLAGKCKEDETVVFHGSSGHRKKFATPAWKIS